MPPYGSKLKAGKSRLLQGKKGQCLKMGLLAYACLQMLTWQNATRSATKLRELRLHDGKAPSMLSGRFLPPLHVAFGLSGNHPGFLAEFQVALKSVLLNSPLERDLFVHILADNVS